jgi:hypothetical protein
MTTLTKQKFIKFSHENKCILFLINNELYDDFYDEFKKSTLSYNEFSNDDNCVFLCFFQLSSHDTLYHENAIKCIYQHLFDDFYDESDECDENINKIVVECVQYQNVI